MAFNEIHPQIRVTAKSIPWVALQLFFREFLIKN